MNSRVVAAVAAAVLAVVGIGALVAYASSANSRAFDDAELLPVYQVTQAVSPNTAGADLEGSVELVKLPRKAIAEGAISDLSKVTDLKTVSALAVGEQLLTSKFDKTGSAAASSVAIPEGQQQVSFDVSPSGANLDVLKPGSLVGIFVTAEDESGTKTKMLAQKVLVTNASVGAEGAGIITVAADGKLATKIAAAANTGSIRLSVQDDKTNTDAGGAVTVSSLVK